MNKVNTKWLVQNKEVIEQKLKVLDKNIIIITANSTDHKLLDID